MQLRSRLTVPASLFMFVSIAGCGAPGAPSGAGGAGGNGGAGGQGGSSSGGRGGSGGTGAVAGSTGGSTGGASAPGGSGGGGSGAAGSGAAGTDGTGGTGGGAGTGGTGGSVPGDGGGEAGGSGGSTMPPPAGMAEPPLPPCKRTVEVAGAGALGGALGGAMPGDCLVLADGDYPAPTITAQGTAEAPIVLRAANRLKANFMGVVRLMDAAHVMLEGFTFPGGSGTSIAGASHHCRVSRSRYFTGTANVAGNAKDNRIDRCEFGPKTTDGNMVRPTGLSENTRIDRNYFHDVSGGGNGRETIRLGCCGEMYDLHETGNIVEHNLLVNCSGEAEIISIKASKNTVRYNTIRNSTGNLTLRAGKNNLIYGNFVFGTGNQGGLRIFDDGHKIWNNYIQTGRALIGNRSGPIHAAVRNAVIVHNTFIGAVDLTGSGNVFSDNITGGSANLGGAMAQGNLTADAAGLMLMGEALAITAQSRAVDAATGSYPFITDDVNGQPRSGKLDVGADEWSSAPAPHRPLTPADVGPNAP